MNLESPFARLRALLDDIQPATDARVSLDIGSPQHAAPAAVLAALAQDDDYAAYPPIGGLDIFHAATRDWLARRFNLAPEFLKNLAKPLPLAGTREGLFLAAQLAPTTTATSKSKMERLLFDKFKLQPRRGFRELNKLPSAATDKKSKFLIPDPFYQLYAAAAEAAAKDETTTPLYLPATRANGFLPALGDIEEHGATLRAVYFCNPSNPQGAVAPREYLRALLALAIKKDFLLLVDECYIDIYSGNEKPISMLEIMAENNNKNAPVLIFHSLSKRSNLAGLRSGFVVGGNNIMKEFLRLRLLAGAQSPAPVQRAAALAWADDKHAADNRALYQQKFALAEQIFSDAGVDKALQFYRPQGGFFLWLHVADFALDFTGAKNKNITSGEAFAKNLWHEYGVRVLPGIYLSAKEDNEAKDYIRVALCAPQAEIEQGLKAIAALAKNKISKEQINKGRAA